MTIAKIGIDYARNQKIKGYILHTGSRRDLNAPAIRLIEFSISGAFESIVLGSQAYAYEMPACALRISFTDK